MGGADVFAHQMKLISVHPVGPASSFNLPLLHAHQLVSLPGDGGLREVTGQGENVIIIQEAAAEGLFKSNNVNARSLSRSKHIHAEWEAQSSSAPIKNNYSDKICTYERTWHFLSRPPSKQLKAYL